MFFEIPIETKSVRIITILKYTQYISPNKNDASMKMVTVSVGVEVCMDQGEAAARVGETKRRCWSWKRVLMMGSYGEAP